jgi:hypothetical protein
MLQGVLGQQSTDSGPRAQLRRGNEPTGGANSSAPCSVILNFSLGSYLSSSLAAQGADFFNEKRLAHSGPLGGIARSLETTTT